MNRRILILAVLFGVLISFASCVNDEDDSTVSQEWKTYNEQQVRNASSSGYTPRPSQSGDVYKRQALSDRQMGAMMIADDAYAGSQSFVRYQKAVEEVLGKKYLLPVHQGLSLIHI